METSIHDMLLAALAGLLGAPHCIGMCGGIAAGLALQAKRSPWWTVGAYNLGRTAMYTLIGALMGMAGSFLEAAGQLAQVQGAATLLGGVMILLWALRRWTVPLSYGVRVERLAARIREAEGVRPALLSGFVLGLLPCGLTYAMEMNAAASGTALGGALRMAAFGLGTVPALLLVGVFAGRLGRGLRRSARLLGQMTAVWMGILCILRGCAASGWIPGIHPWLW